jgi:hypothetical protein
MDMTALTEITEIPGVSQIIDFGDKLIEEPHLLVIIFFVYALYNKVENQKDISSEYTTKKNMITNKYKAKIKEKVKTVLRTIRNTSISNAEQLLKAKEKDPFNNCSYGEVKPTGACACTEETTDPCEACVGCSNPMIDGNRCIMVNDKSEFKYQYNLFIGALKDSLDKHVFDAILNAIYQNGFHKLNGNELDDYMSNKSKEVLELSRDNIKLGAHLFPCLINTDEQRFDSNQSKGFFQYIVEFYIELEREEELELKALEKEFTDSNKFQMPNIKKILIKWLSPNDKD